ncbi:MAG: methylated-DNA--[protein]-cysteine S-methyltransferase [Deltaproteobacteria bacterium]|nr:methylated-DNA--[protein]-cysteine S-methyltransferase [Deltaproteobacteria bacterium]
MDLYVKYMQTPAGEIVIYANDRAVVGLYTGKYNSKKLKDRYRRAREEDHPVLQRAQKEIEAYFAGRLTTFTVPVEFSGTPFQEAVWRALLEIGHGELRSYAEVAAKVGKPKASRAVGGAVGRNPVSIIIPCHRVIGSNATLTGFGGGLPVKTRLLRAEGHLVEGSKVV